jgi:hypothetical protein
MDRFDTSADIRRTGIIPPPFLWLGLLCAPAYIKTIVPLRRKATGAACLTQVIFAVQEIYG